MNQALFIVATTIAMVTGVVSLLIVAIKARSDREARRVGRRRRTLSRRVEAYLRGERSSIGEALADGTRSRDRAVVEDILLRGIIGREGTDFRKFALAFEELGLVALYLENIERRGWWHRARAAENLGLVRVRRAQDALTRSLQDENPEVRFRAARALGRIADPAVMPTLILTLNEPDRFSTIRIANVLVSVGAGINEPIMASFEELKPGARVAALDVLSSIGSVETGPWLRKRLKDADSDVRSRAARALGAIGDLFAGPMLVEALKDPEWPVRAGAAKALATLRYAPSVPDLCVALRDSEWWVRSNAAESLRAMGEVGLTALESMLDDSDAYARHQAVFMLEEAGILDERVGDIFAASNRRRERSRTFVDQVIESGQCVRLSELAGDHADLEVRTFLAHMLREVRPPGELAND
ncbi:MAG TPA: HEAT repeat domain-containing protein [Myxococcales bacterium]|nr:HEAT repeat domain-containing protein [Myxococcales bacterium]